ncbi:hypothetical protein GPECTOR_48g449 [Gonium pectorale]|uniref:Uncharacterized protein n=1 Tax=Gonium pectorale TaxID=33097 RepID=A0A150G828_GONPE|nr:hypothetical protein GPECTOR_48g449 [Gonium pectorale]|eukprot:KXZ46016.1 hypothetical protein GPECTOR_48g449 [Gonium pectorale]
MAQQHPAEAPARELWSSRVWPQLLPELAERIVGCLSCNDVAAAFRQVNKATAEAFSGPQHTIVRLSEPVPPHAFAAHWLAPGATRGLNLVRRRKLVRLVAASGVLPNMEVMLQAAGFYGAAAEALNEAALAGQLLMCQWLWDQLANGADDLADPRGEYNASSALAFAACGGHRHVCEWLLALVDRVSPSAENLVYAAASRGHVDLAEWLLQQDIIRAIRRRLRLLR